MAETEEQASIGGRCAALDPDLTAERERTLHALQESEERFRVAFRTSPDSININRLEDGLYIDVNDGFTRVSGFTREEVIGRTSLEINIWAEPADRARLVAALRAEDAVEGLEARFRRKDGSVITGLMSARLIVLRGQPCILSITRDISRIKATEQALDWERRAHAALAELGKTLLAAGSLSLAEISRQVLDHARALTGSRFGFVGYIDPRTGHLVSPTLTRDIAPGMAAAQGDGPIVFTRFAGLWGWVLTHRRPLLTNHPEEDPRSGGTPPGHIRIDRFVAAPALIGDDLVGEVALANPDRDYTERDLWLTERFADLYAIAIRRSRDEAALRTLSRAVEQSPSSVVITDLDGTIDYVNPAFTRITGYSAAEAVGRNPRLLKSGETPPEAYAELWSTITAGRIWRGQFHNRRKDDTLFWESASIAPIKDDTGTVTHFVAVKEDITDRKQQEIELLAAKEQAESSSRAKSAFLAHMSHELRTPLNAIIGFAQLMEQRLFGPVGDPRYGDYVAHIAESGQHLLSLIDDILDLSTIEAGRMVVREQILEVGPAVRSAGMMMRPRADAAQLRLVIDCAAGMPQLRADGRMLRQILLNLLSQAVRSTPPGGRVAVDSASDAAGAVLIRVSDTGTGLTERELAQAMTPFGRDDNPFTCPDKGSGQGSGLGLPLTKALIELHGGTLEVASAPGRGTSAAVHFPAERSVPLLGRETRPAEAREAEAR